MVSSSGTPIWHFAPCTGLECSAPGARSRFVRGYLGSLGDVTSSEGDHLETEQKYDADAEFVLPNLGSLPELSRQRARGSETDLPERHLLRHRGLRPSQAQGHAAAPSGRR